MNKISIPTKYLYLRGNTYYLRIQNPTVCFSLKTNELHNALSLRNKFEKAIEILQKWKVKNVENIKRIRDAIMSNIDPVKISERITKGLVSHDKYQPIEEFVWDELDLFCSSYEVELENLNAAIDSYTKDVGKPPSKALLDDVKPFRGHYEGDYPMEYMAAMAFMLRGSPRHMQWMLKASKNSALQSAVAIESESEHQYSLERTMALTEANIQRDFFKKHVLLQRNDSLLVSKEKEAEGEYFSEVFQSFLGATHSEKLSEDRIRKFNQTVKLFIWGLSDKPIDSYTREELHKFFWQDMHQFRNDLLRDKQSKIFELGRDKYEFTDLEDDEKYTQSTISKHQQRINQIFSWATSCGKLIENQLKNIKKVPDKGGKERGLFPIESLQTAFSNRLYYRGFVKYAWQYWIPLLSLTTGARPNEIAQLTREDITFNNDRFFLDINDKNGKSVKTKSSIRKIPVSNRLVELGFKEFVSSLSIGEGVNIWEGLTADSTTGYYSAKISYWFITKFESLGLAREDHEKRVLDYYSFRHYFITKAASLNDEDSYKAYVGHSRGSGVSKRYIKGFDIEKLCAFVDMLNFPELANMPTYGEVFC